MSRLTGYILNKKITSVNRITLTSESVIRFNLLVIDTPGEMPNTKSIPKKYCKTRWNCLFKPVIHLSCFTFYECFRKIHDETLKPAPHYLRTMAKTNETLKLVQNVNFVLRVIRHNLSIFCKMLSQNVFAGVGSLVMNTKYFLYCSKGYFQFLRKLLSMTNCVRYVFIMFRETQSF